MTDDGSVSGSVTSSILYSTKPEMRLAYVAGIIDSRITYDKRGHYVQARIQACPPVLLDLVCAALGGKVVEYKRNDGKRTNGKRKTRTYYAWTAGVAQNYAKFVSILPFLVAKFDATSLALAHAMRHSKRVVEKRIAEDVRRQIEGEKE